MTVPKKHRSALPAFFLLGWTATLASVPAWAAPPAASTPAEPVYDTYASGPLALKSAEPLAIAKNRRILANFGTNDCAPCAAFAAAIRESAAFDEALRDQFVLVWIDVSPGSPNEQLLKVNEIDPAKGLPAVVLIDVASKTAEIFRNGEAAKAARNGPEAVRSFLLKSFRVAAAP